MNVLSVIIGVFLIVLIVMMLRWMMKSSSELLSMSDAKISTTISSSSLSTNDETPASNFTYEVFIYISDWNYRYGYNKVVFGRMGEKSAESLGEIEGINGNEPCPLVYLDAYKNDLNVAITCFANGEDQFAYSIHKAKIQNIPLQKWVYIAIVVNNRILDMYVDGKLTSSNLMIGTAKTNANANLYTCLNGGYAGYISALNYFAYAKNPAEVYADYESNLSSWNVGSFGLKLSLLNNGNETSSLTI